MLSNRDVEGEIKKGNFREDLYYRLNVVALKMPPLRKRKEDIPLLAEHFLQRFTRETNKRIDRVDRGALDEMMLHEWPGNVRELENAIERAVVVGKGRHIQAGDLPFVMADVCREPSGESLQAMEKAHIANILEANQWNVARSAKILKIDRSTLYSKIKRYDLRR